ncbi:hypothetical protein MLD38_030506 [Melastoma candidum]|uniref:Uncharacterized protein n=1 Tax=Melastoma candidum TaxID=119954 RepID=A0ACB9MM10_9MYRT|nr:hypothetical protein MLD38_030506 [Melastoma candidum]
MSSCYRVPVLALNALFVLGACFYLSEATFFPPPCPCQSSSPPPRNYTATFYSQVVLANGTNNGVANTVPVAGLQGKAFTPSQFGTDYVFDVNVTTTASPTSAMIGKAYGTLAVTGLNGFVVMASLTFVFTSGNLAGSTLTTQGIFDLSQQVSNIAIPGGTNALTYATGYVVARQVSQQPNMVIQVTANYIIPA